MLGLCGKWGWDSTAVGRQRCGIRTKGTRTRNSHRAGLHSTFLTYIYSLSLTSSQWDSIIIGPFYRCGNKGTGWLTNSAMVTHLWKLRQNSLCHFSQVLYSSPNSTLSFLDALLTLIYVPLWHRSPLHEQIGMGSYTCCVCLPSKCKVPDYISCVCFICWGVVCWGIGDTK